MMITNFFTQAGLNIGLPVVVVLFLYAGKNRNNILLACSLFSLWYAALLTYLVVTQKILDYPYLFRTANLISYLIFPLLYLYTKNSFYPGKFWRKRHWLLLLPSLLYLVDLFPYFSASYQYKLEHISRYMSNPPALFQVGEGSFLPVGFHYILLYVWSLTFYVLQLNILYRNRRISLHTGDPKHKVIFNFILTLSLMYLPCIFPGVLGVVLHLKWYSANSLNVSLVIGLLTVTGYLLMRPEILSGFAPGKSLASAQAGRKMLAAAGPLGRPLFPEGQFIDLVDERENPAGLGTKRIAPKSPREIMTNAGEYLKTSLAFTNPEYTIHDLSKDIAVPAYLITPVIYNVFRASFVTWLNRYRVAYFIEQVNKCEPGKIDIEKLAAQSGFRNMVSFTYAFRKEKGMPPAKYFKAYRLG